MGQDGIGDTGRVAVQLPTQTIPPRNQTVVGKKSWIHDIEEFRGIPYGTVPARWQHSIPRESLPTDIFDASHHGPKCPQPSEPNNTEMFHSHLSYPDSGESEFDCLNLFIVRPSPVALERAGLGQTTLPVYVYIHGGGYGWGASTDPIWEPTRLVAHSLRTKKPMVAVFLNYRLHVFGFAGSPEVINSQPDSGIRGCNFGLGDQRTALIWISQNISAFGGDPNRVTIGGQSAGSSSIHAHVIQARLESRRPLFRRAIMQSGAVGTLGPISMEEASSMFNVLCEQLSVSDVGSKSRMESLLATSAEKLLKAGLRTYGQTTQLINDGLTIKPATVGRWHMSFGDAESDHKASERSTEQPIVVLLGNLDAEGRLFDNAINKIPDFQRLEAVFSPSFTSKVLPAYGIKPGSSLSEIREGLTDFMTDWSFGFPVYLAMTELTSSKSEGVAHPTFIQRYRISYGNPFQGRYHDVAIHNVDMMYLYDCFHEDMVKADESDMSQSQYGVTNLELVYSMQKYWIDFIADDEVATTAEDQVLHWGKDRVQRLESISESPEWAARRRRFEVLGQNWAEAKAASIAMFEANKF